ncbi:hypothetical protein Q5752_004009 [Cryptotrichosporon argae]
MLRDIVERPTTSPSAPTAPTPTPTPGAPAPRPPRPPHASGFPIATHRTKSAFARRAAAGGTVALGRVVDAVPAVGLAGPSARSQSSVPGTPDESEAGTARAGSSEAEAVRADRSEAKMFCADSDTTRSDRSEADAVRADVDEDNAARIARMSAAEREAEAAELRDLLGDGLADKMRRIRALREARERARDGPAPSGEGSSGQYSRLAGQEGALREVEPTRPGQAGDAGPQPDAAAVLRLVDEENRRKVADMSAEERAREVGDLEERFGLALLGRLKEAAERRARPVSTSTVSPPPPAAPLSEDAKLEWTRDPEPEPEPEPALAAEAPDPRFDLAGRVLSAEAAAALPVHLGLHHHGNSPSLAGYTLGDMLHLARSTVPAQRALMLSVLARVCAAYHLGALDGAARTEVEAQHVLDQTRELGADAVGAPNIGVVRAGLDALYEAVGGSTWGWMDAPAPGEAAPFCVDAVFDALNFEAVAPRLYTVAELALVPAPAMAQLARLARRLAHSEQHAHATPFAPVLARTGTPDALALVRDVTAASRDAAQALARQGTYDALLRHVVGAEPGAEIVLETYTAAARYGLCASLALSARDAWVDLVASLDARPALVVPTLDLLTAWTVCAVDPHRTTPEHDLTWAQIDGLGWADDALAVLGRSLGARERDDHAAAAVRLLVAWLEGCTINAPRAGEAAKAAVRAALDALDVPARLPLSVAAIPATRAFAELATALLRLNALVRVLDDVSLERYTFFYAATTATGRADRDLRYAVLCAARGREAGIMSRTQWASSAFDLLLSLEPGDEPAALALVDAILALDQDDVGHADGLVILRPLLHHAVLPNVDDIVGPRTPAHLYLKATTTLRPPPATLAAEPHAGLPLAPDWTQIPLNELLNSANSQALAQAPRDWQPSETEIARATLALVKMQQGTSTVDRAHVVLAAMKVFMLEHNADAAPGVAEVFRDGIVAQLLDDVLAPLCVDRTGIALPAPLEAAAAAFTSAPFFQFYTDLVALYAAVSFGDALFSRVILAPLAMGYAADYRRLVWCDSASVLRAIRTAPADVPRAAGLRDFFEPAETDGDVLRAMARALVAGSLGGAAEARFLYALAVGHLARLWWDSAETARDSARVETMVAVMAGGSDDVVRALLYEGGAGEQVVAARKDMVGQAFGDKGARRVAPL